MKTKKLLAITTIGVIAFTILSSFNIPNIKKNYVKFEDTLYACRYEVTNIEYREFLTDLKATNQNDNYLKCMYDSTQWTKKWPWSFNEPMANYYHWHAAYNNYPIVNITLDAAKSYCEWLTDKYNKSTKKSFKKVLFRLPTVSEWEDLAAPLSGHNLPWYGNFPYTDAEGKIALANIKVKTIHGYNNYIFDDGFHTLTVGHYKPNNIGIYDVIGNVAEMTKNDTIKGGSWDNYLKECLIDTIQKYTLPDPRVGFRVIMEVIEK
jgi:formylglycine-generating enzyme required for sulfatase activity